MLSLIDEAQLSDIPEIKDPEIREIVKAAHASMEDLPSVNGGDVTSDMSSRMQSPDNIAYTINPLPKGGGKMISFYMNFLNLTSQAINQFVMLSDILVTEKDGMLIHFNSSLYCDEAETIYSAISACKAKAKVGSAPYILNTAGFFPVLACDYIISSPYVFAHFDTPSIRGGGNFRDAENGFAFDKRRKLRLLEKTNEAGFLSAAAYEKILKQQGSYTLYGKEYIDAIARFNARVNEK